MISLNLLRSYTGWDLTDKEIIDGFIRLGIEVEEVTHRDNIEGTRIGIIREITPITEKLNLTKTEVGEGDVREIVTNSKTVKVGDKVIAALPGGRVGDLQVGERKLQGTMSYGVFLGAKETGVPLEILPAEERDGVWILPKDAPEFTDPAESLWLKDIILDASLTPNHPEWQGLEGLIRELAIVLWWKTGEIPEVPKFEAPKLTFTGKTSDKMAIEIDDKDGCIKYTGIYAQIDSVKPSGFDARKKLLASFMRPINNVVDASNLMMYFTNQPTHAFDADKIKSHKIKVSSTKSETEFVTLDKVTHKLPKDTLMICDDEIPIGIAGIMGGLDSEVSNDTKNILLESACFSNTKIAQTVSLTGIRTDASSRFDKGADPETTERTAYLVLEMIGGTPSEPLTIGNDVERNKLTLRSSRMQKILGYLPKIDDVKKGFSLLGLNCTGDNDLGIDIPGFRRVDLSAEIDLIEEAVRVTGYDNVPATLPLIKLNMMHEKPEFDFERRLRRITAGIGFNECVTLTFTNEDELKKFQLESKLDLAPKISNPMTADATMLRPTGEIGLINTAAGNIRQGNHDLKLFEIGSQFGPETRTLMILLHGKNGTFWDKESNTYDFFDMKGIIHTLLSQLSISNFIAIESNDNPHLHPERQAKITADKETIGYFGELHPDISDTFDFPDKVQIANIDIPRLMNVLPEKIKFVQTPKFPPVYRDISMLCPESISSSEIEKRIMESCDEKLSSVRLFDLFVSDENKEKGIKSLAYSLVFVDKSGTIKGEEIDSQIEKVILNLKEIGAIVRTG